MISRFFRWSIFIAILGRAMNSINSLKGRLNASSDSLTQIVFYTAIIAAILLLLIVVIIIFNLCYYCAKDRRSVTPPKRRSSKIREEDLEAKDRQKGQFGDLNSNLELRLNVSEISLGNESNPNDRSKRKTNKNKDKTSAEKMGDFFEEKKRRRSKIERTVWRTLCQSFHRYRE